MNYFKIIIHVFVVTVLLSSCEDAVMNRYPTDEISPETYFKTENDLRTYTNSFYPFVPDWNDIWNHAGSMADNEARFSVSSQISGQRTVPTTGGGWSWGTLRNINFFLEHIDQFEGQSETKNHYEGVARFFRAWFYFQKVKRFGDVPWYSGVIDTDNEQLLIKARDSRTTVMDSVLTDINYAINNLKVERNTTRITKWTALALKSRAFLYEGTFRKYHEIAGYETMLDESISASLELMTESGYGIYKSTKDKAYRELFIARDAISEELILAREYDGSIPYTHSVNFRTNSSSYGRPGVTKQLIDSYLMEDGSRFTDKPNYGTMEFYEETRNRDPRLYQTIRTPGYTRQGEDAPVVPDFSATMTGYQYIKYILPPVHFSEGADNDLPVFRYAEILLNYAEAKAENGTLTQADLDNSIKLIRDRVDMPGINMSQANMTPDPFLENQYENVSGVNKGVILEIRRERRIELIREGFRWDDLMRWKEGDNLTRTFKGMYFPGDGEFDLDQNGTVDLVIYQGNEPSDQISGTQYYPLNAFNLDAGEYGGNINVNENVTKEFDQNKDYLFPIPLQELTLNQNLTQNPGWPGVQN